VTDAAEPDPESPMREPMLARLNALLYGFQDYAVVARR